MLARIVSRLLGHARPPLSLVLYSRPGCHLCEEMKAEIARARPRTPYELSEVDIERDQDLLRRFERSIPVLEIAGRVAFKGRLTATELEAKLERRARERGAGP